MTLQFSDSSPSTIIIAEIANAHEGKSDMARELVQQACQTGADIIKFQFFFGKELVVTAHPRCQHFTKMEMSFEIWKELVKMVHDAGLQAFADVFGVEAAKLAVSCGVDGFKVHSSDTFNYPLLEYLDHQQRPILLSCGGTKWVEIKWALEHLPQAYRAQQIALMHGFQSFPTKLEDSQLKWIPEWKSLFKLPVGFMDHLDAEDPLAKILPLLGIAAGAKLIEKHITLDRSQKGIDYFSSLHPNEFGEMVQSIRRTEIAMGTLPMTMSEDELTYRKKMKKILVAQRDIPLGETLKTEDLTFKRGDFEEHSLYLQEVVGKVLTQPLKADEAVTQHHFSHRIGILIAVRMHSTRFPQKALKTICGQTTIEHLMDRVKLSKRGTVVVLCTSEDPIDDPLPPLAAKKQIPCIRGASDDVMARFLKAVDLYHLDMIVRITGDDILIDPIHLDMAIDHHLRHNNDYTDCKALPSGTEGEVVSVVALRRAYELAEDSSYSEYMTSYFKNEHFFKTGSLPVAVRYQKNWRLTIDYPEDFEVFRTVLEGIYHPQRPYTMDELVTFIEQHPDLLRINQHQKTKNTLGQINTRLALFH